VELVLSRGRAAGRMGEWARVDRPPLGLMFRPPTAHFSHQFHRTPPVPPINNSIANHPFLPSVLWHNTTTHTPDALDMERVRTTPVLDCAGNFPTKDMLHFIDAARSLAARPCVHSIPIYIYTCPWARHLPFSIDADASSHRPHPPR
jgi:hypothetical protein